MQKLRQFNQYILERYPTVWNTKIIWMLLISIGVHLIFFGIGYGSHTDPRSLQTYSVKDDYFRSGMIFIHLIISILMIVGWLIMMLKNNAFKNFYPGSKWKLFSQFVQYFIILLASTTFFFSYMIGFSMFINHQYPDQELEKNIEVINRAYPFLSQEIESYTLDNRMFPKPFSELFCETDINKIDPNKKYFVYYNRVYQYYSVDPKISNTKDRYGNFLVPEPGKTNPSAIAYTEQNGSSEIFYFKKGVVDLSPYIKTTGLSYYNFSKIFYDGKPIHGGTRYSKYNEPDIDNGYQKKSFDINKNTTELLDRNHPAELERLLRAFLKIAKEYQIATNLDAKEWTQMVFSEQNENFELRQFIRKAKENAGESGLGKPGDYIDTAIADTEAVIASSGMIVQDSVAIKQLNPEINRQVSPEVYFKNNLSNYYFYTDALKEVLDNVEMVKTYDFFSENIPIYLWIAFFLSTFIFSFRIVGLRSLLFSVISTGVLALSIILITVLYAVSWSGNEEFFASYLTLMVSLIILIVPLFLMRRVGKLASSVFLIISMNGFALFVLLIFRIISMHQRVHCIHSMMDPSIACPTIMSSLGVNLNYLILGCSFLFMYCYTSILQKWKAMPE